MTRCLLKFLIVNFLISVVLICFQSVIFIDLKINYYSKQKNTWPAVKLNRTDPQGAWWLAYLIAGTLTVLFAIPIILLPDKIVSIKSRNLSISVNDKREMSIKDAWSTFKFLMRNQIIVIINIVSGLDFFTFLGLNTFLAKYIAFALHMTESEAAFFVGLFCYNTNMFL